jgi:hypothetical protein
VAEFLIHKLGARIDIEDWDGISAKTLAMHGMSEFVSPAASIVKQAVTQQGRAAQKTERRKCANCGKPEPTGTKFDVCSRCKQIRYCGRSCQGKKSAYMYIYWNLW